MTAPPLDTVDIYHGNVISDASKIPMLKAFSHKACEGGTSKDPLFAQRMPIVSRFPRQGAAMWIRSDFTAEQHVANLSEAMDKAGFTVNGKLPEGRYILIDWETTQNVAPVSISEGEAIINALDDKFGDRDVNYMAEWAPGFAQWRKDSPHHGLWYADYNLSDGVKKCAKYGATCWQFTDKAIVAGFRDPVDGNTILDPVLFDRICNYNQPKPSPEEDDMPREYVTNSESRSDENGASFGPRIFLYIYDPGSGRIHHVIGDSPESKMPSNVVTPDMMAAMPAFSNSQLDAWLAVDPVPAGKFPTMASGLVTLPSIPGQFPIELQLS